VRKETVEAVCHTSQGVCDTSQVKGVCDMSHTRDMSALRQAIDESTNQYVEKRSCIHQEGRVSETCERDLIERDK